MAKKKAHKDPAYYVKQHLSVLINDWTEAVQSLEKINDLKVLCVSLQSLSDQYEQIDILRKELGALFDKLNEAIVPKAFEDAGIDKIAVPELGRSFYPLTKYSASIVKGRNESALAWLKTNGLGSLVTETVHRGTLAATLHDRLINEGKDPPDSMTLTSYKITGSSKYTPKGK